MVRYKAIAPLLHFESEEAESRLADGVLIRGMEPEEREMWKSRAGSLMHDMLAVYQADPEAAEFVLDVEISTESRELGPPILQRFFEVVTALRLFAPGNLGAPIMDYEVETQRGRKGGFSIWYDELGIRRYSSRPFLLLHDTVEPLRSFLHQVEGRLPFEDMPAYPGLAFALRRFNYTYSRIHAEDRLVDAIIALEALLLSKNGRGKGTPLAGRVAALLGRTDSERLAVRGFVRAAYDARNDVLHEGRPIDDAIAGRTDLVAVLFVERLERHLAAAIRAIADLPSGTSRNDFLKDPE